MGASGIRCCGCIRYRGWVHQVSGAVGASGTVGRCIRYQVLWVHQVPWVGASGAVGASGIVPWVHECIMQLT